MESRVSRRTRYVGKARAELGRLEGLGVTMAGNAFSPVLIVKGAPGPAEHDGKGLCAGEDGTALKAALVALGYAPEEWCALAAWRTGGEPLEGDLMRTSLSALAPTTVVLCDEEAAARFRDAYAEELADVESLDAALLAPGVVCRVLGMRVMNLGGFERALADTRQKQLMWARLKQLPPLGEPY